MTKEEAIDYLEWVRPKKPYTQDKKNVQTAIDMAIEALKDRPHGEWIKKHYSDQMAWATCSVCGSREEQIYNESPNATEDTMVICRYFCPNCGADMSANDRQVTGKLNSEIEKSKGW